LAEKETEMELKFAHKNILKRLEHSSCSVKDFTHSTLAVGNQGFHYERYFNDLERMGYVVLIGDYYHITSFGVAKLEEKKVVVKATKVTAGTTTEIYDGADLRMNCHRQGAYDFLKYPSKLGENLVYPKQYV
jgi:hypothetical protein